MHFTRVDHICENKRCQKPFRSYAGNARWCDDCRAKAKRDATRRSHQRKRDSKRLARILSGGEIR